MAEDYEINEGNIVAVGPGETPAVPSVSGAAPVSHYAPSLVGRRFSGSDQFFFLVDHPREALEVPGWLHLLENIAARFRSGLQLRTVETDYASYRLGERVRVRVRVANLRLAAVATEIRFWVKAPDQQEFLFMDRHRRCPDAGSESEAIGDLLLSGPPGLWKIRVEACQDPQVAEELAIEGKPIPLDRREIGVVLWEGEVRTPWLMTLNGPRIQLEGQDGYWAGTHYYPSSSWWEWAWRDFRPLLADRDFAGIRRAGYRMVRVWIDPVLDEQTLRAMDAAIYLAARHSLVLDVCIFTQWVRTLGFERPNGEHVYWDFKRQGEANIYCISLHHLDLQKEYVQILAQRWREAGNVLYNLANETYLKDPDETQMDPEVAQWARAFRPERVYVLIPTAKNDNLEAAWTVFRGLWHEKVPFGVWHEDCLDDLPKTTHVLLCPDGVTLPESPARLETLRLSGIKVFRGPGEDWKETPDLPRLQVTPKEGVNLLVRRTLEGTLYSLFGSPPEIPVTLETERPASVTLGLTSCALVHERPSGINLIEASGEVTTRGQGLCRIASGRVILIADDDAHLLSCRRTRVVATGPTRIEFHREMVSLTVLEEGRDTPLGTLPVEGKVLDLDCELQRYVLLIAWKGS